MKIKYLLSKDIRSKPFNDLIRRSFPNFLKESNPEIIVVSGGDGSLLHAIQKYNKYKAPFLGRAAGTLNFLMNKFPNDQRILELIQNDAIELKFLETKSIKVTLQKFLGKKKVLGYAINDVLVGSDIMGYHHFKIDSADQSFEDFEVKGSGICISTDLGSTGYNFNLGGPVLPLGSGFWSIQGIVANRRIDDILKHQKITIEYLSSKPNTQVFLDGIIKNGVLEQNDKIILSVGETVKLAFIDDSDFARRRIEITSRYRKS